MVCAQGLEKDLKEHLGQKLDAARQILSTMNVPSVSCLTFKEFKRLFCTYECKEERSSICNFFNAALEAVRPFRDILARLGIKKWFPEFKSEHEIMQVLRQAQEEFRENQDNKMPRFSSEPAQRIWTRFVQNLDKVADISQAR